LRFTKANKFYLTPGLVFTMPLKPGGVKYSLASKKQADSPLYLGSTSLALANEQNLSPEPKPKNKIKHELEH